MTEAEKAYQYFVIAVPENEEQAKAYFWARKALRPVSRERVENVWRGEWIKRHKHRGGFRRVRLTSDANMMIFTARSAESKARTTS